MRSLLFGVGVTDLETFVAVLILLACIALVASYVPARFPALVQPLRCDANRDALLKESSLEGPVVDCSKSGSRSIALALRRFDEFRRGILAASYAAVSMVVQLGLMFSKPVSRELHGPLRRFADKSVLNRMVRR